MRAIAVAALLLALTMIGGAPLRAEADGPDTWDVTGVRADDTLHMHPEASARSRTIARIPHDAKGLRSLGCTGTPTFAEWSRMSAAERARSARARWCRVEFQGTRGWVAGRYLKEGGSDAAAVRLGPWTIACRARCALEQVGVGTARRTVLRLEQRPGNNAEITIERSGVARRGTLAIYMDGETVSAGPIAPLAAKGGGRLVLAADDITAGLLKRMAAHKNMVLSFPGEERGVEIHLDRFEEAWQELARRSPGQ